jgi:hypothetical protein
MNSECQGQSSACYSEHSLIAKKRRTKKLSVAKVGGHCCYQFDTPSDVLAVGAGIVHLSSTFRAARRNKIFTALGFGEEPVPNLQKQAYPCPEHSKQAKPG